MAEVLVWLAEDRALSDQKMTRSFLQLATQTQHPKEVIILRHYEVNLFLD